MMIQHILPPQKPLLPPKLHIHHTSEIFDAALAAHSMVFRSFLFVQRSGFLFFRRLRAEIKGDDGGKDRQKFLAV